MRDPDFITDEVVKFLGNRTMLSTGTREELRTMLRKMMLGEQRSLDFDVCANNHGGNEQSMKAQELHSGRRVSQKKRVYLHIHSTGQHGATCEEIEKALGMSHQTCSARVSELKRAEMIRESGQRMTTTGSPAAVLVVA